MKKYPKTWVWIIILSLPSIVYAQSVSSSEHIFMPSFASLNEGWNTLKPGGETKCAFGTAYQFYVRPGDPKKILVYFTGGGACWDYETCKPGTEYYSHEINPNNNPSRYSGILDIKRKDNPFAEYTMIAFPSCTGDTHLGNGDITFMPEAEGEPYTIYYRGSVNVSAGLEWIHKNDLQPDDLFVAGSSAGGVAVPLYASMLADRYPRARVAGLTDDVGSYKTGTLPKSNFDNCGCTGFIQAHTDWKAYTGTDKLDRHMKYALQNRSNLRLYMVDHHNDPFQNFFHEKAGTENPDVAKLMRETRQAIQKDYPQFRGYILGGKSHVSLIGFSFYTIKSSGYPLRDWVDNISKGKDVPNIECTDCEFPEFIYSQTDLITLLRLKELIPNKSNWQRDDSGNCRTDAKTYSLRCALLKSINETTNELPRANTIFREISYRTAAMVPFKKENNTPIIDFNNDPNIGYEGIMLMLNQVQERIESSLSQDSSK